jgi:hypothetical protein
MITENNLRRIRYYIDQGEEPVFLSDSYMLPIDPHWLTTPELRGQLWALMDRLSRIESGT